MKDWKLWTATGKVAQFVFWLVVCLLIVANLVIQSESQMFRYAAF